MIPEPELSPLALLVRRLCGDASIRHVARATGLSTSLIADLRNGHVATYPTLLQFTEGIGASPAEREELFSLAGYRDEERPLVAALVAAVRDAGLPVADTQYLTPELVDAVAAALAGVRVRR